MEPTHPRARCLRFPLTPGDAKKRKYGTNALRPTEPANSVGRSAFILLAIGWAIHDLPSILQHCHSSGGNMHFYVVSTASYDFRNERIYNSSQMLANFCFF